MADPIIFALTRFKGFFDTQPYRALIIETDEVRLVPEEGEVMIFPFQQLEKVELTHSRSLNSGILQQLGGFLTRPKEDLIRFEAGAKTYEVALEIDSFHRKDDLKEALRRLYHASVQVKEQTGAGKKTFLLQPMTAEEIEEALAALKS